MKGETLVGREAELLEIEQALSATLHDDRGALFFLTGEPGIGKTRLADEITTIAKRRGFLIAWGRCWEVGGAPAFWPWIQILRKLARDPAIKTVMQAYDSVLSRLLPELRSPHHRQDEEAAGASVHDARARFRLLDELGALMRAVAENAPLALVFDDLHAADPSSLALLQLVARDLRQSRIVLVATCRDREANPEPVVSDGIRALAREGTTMVLRRFQVDEVAQILSAHMKSKGVTPARALAERVQKSTDGNPLFVEQVSRLLTADANRKDGEIPIPSAMRDAIRSRLDGLGPSTRRCLEHAAVLGRDFTPAMLAKVMGEMSETDAMACIAEGARAGLLHEVSTGQFEICHALFRDALYRELPTTRRHEIHAHAAEALEQSGVPERALGEVARHLLAALPVVGAEKVLVGCTQAARRALDALAFEDAASILRSVLSELPEASSVASDVRAEALILHCEALTRASSGDEAKRACEEAAAIARRRSDASLLARAGLALGAEIVPGFINATLVAVLEEARTKLPEESSPLRARVLARLAGALQPAPDPRVPAAMARESVAMARQLGDPSVLRRVLRDAGSALFAVGDPEELAGWDTELLFLSEQIGDIEGAIHARGRLFFEMLDRGLVAEADAHLESHAELADRSGVPEHQWRTLTMRALRALCDGRFEDAETFKGQARRVAAHAGSRIADEAARVALFQTLGTSLARGEPAPQACVEEIGLRMASFPLATGATLAMRAFLAAQNRDAEGVRSLLRQLEEDPIIKTAHQCNRLAVDALTFVEDARIAKMLYDVFHPGTATRLFSWGRIAMFVEGPVTWLLGTLATTMGEYTLAEEHFMAALDRTRSLGLKPYEAITCREYARLLRARGGDSDGQRLAEVRERGRAIAESLGLDVLARQFSVSSSDPPVVAHVAQPQPGATVTMTKEGDVWCVAGGPGTKMIRVKDTRGLQLLAELVSRPGRELHVLSLMGSEGADVGDAGELVDAKAEASYRARVEDLKDQLQEAESFGDLHRAQRARTELQRLEEELASAFGLGGRQRRSGGAAEKARVNVQKRLRDAIKRISDHDPTLGRLLERSVRTGTFCAYEPE